MKIDTETKGVIKGTVSALAAQIMKSYRLSPSAPEPETSREILEDEIAARRIIIAEAQSQIAALKSRQNELLPIQRLPVEVLSIILSMAIPLERHHANRTKLLLVCRAWSRIIDENPSTFWTTLSNHDPLTQRARLLRKAGQMPVTIVVDRHYSSYDSEEDSSSDSAEDFVQSIKANDPPFRELLVSESDESVMDDVFADWLAAPAPHLRSLDLEVASGWVLGGQDPNSQHLRMFSGVAPSLKNVRLSGVCIPWNSAILQNLLSLTLEYQDGDYCTEVDETPSLEEMIGILRSCPALQSLTLRVRDMDFKRSNQVQLPPLSLDRLTRIHLSMSSFLSIFSLLRHIQFPTTATVALAGESPTLLNDNDEILNATLYLLQQHLSIKSFHLAIHVSSVQLSTTRLKVSILNYVRRKRASSYTKVFSRLGSSTLTAIASLHIDFSASRESSMSHRGMNEIIAKLTDLPVDHPHLPKSEKPGNEVLEEVVQTSEDIGQPTWVCPNLRSLEITVGDRSSPDLAAIIKLVRMRKSDIELNGKQVIKAPITFIRITFQGDGPSLDQTDLLDELESEVDVQYMIQPKADEAQIRIRREINDLLSDFEDEESSLSASSDIPLREYISDSDTE